MGAGRPAVAGVGMHEFGRHPDASLKDLARVAIVRALNDAGLGAKDVEIVCRARSRSAGRACCETWASSGCRS
jgi:acetyl-CoA acetyltransferase